MSKELVLEVKNLSIKLKEKGELINAVEDFSIKLKKGKTLGIIGESGSGKSLSCMSILGLLEENKWNIQGEILLNNDPIPYKDNKLMEPYRGKSIALIMQNPISEFDPVMTIEKHFEETLKTHKTMDKEEINKKAIEILKQMHIKNPQKVMKSYPFQCSGGMLQRVMIALAVILEPDILIADEPTTALDLTIQHEIIKILKEMQAKHNTAILIISHDLGVIASLADDISVMYSGNIVESGDLKTILENPSHPYTKGFFNSRPAFSKNRLTEVVGQPPTLKERGTGCQFYSRCSEKNASCKDYLMDEFIIDKNHIIRCSHFNKGEDKVCHF